MGCTVCIVCETSNAIHGRDDRPLVDGPELHPDEWAKFGADVEAIAEFTAAQGLTLVYHHHMGTIVESPHEIDHFMAATGPATKLLLDTGHCFFGGGDPAELARKYMPRVGHIHAKNVRPADRRRGRGRAPVASSKACAAASSPSPATPRAASTSPPVLKIAAEHGYSGWLVIEAEQDPAVRNPLRLPVDGPRRR